MIPFVNRIDLWCLNDIICESQLTIFGPCTSPTKIIVTFTTRFHPLVLVASKHIFIFWLLCWFEFTMPTNTVLAYVAAPISPLFVIWYKVKSVSSLTSLRNPYCETKKYVFKIRQLKISFWDTSFWTVTIVTKIKVTRFTSPPFSIYVLIKSDTMSSNTCC